MFRMNKKALLACLMAMVMLLSSCALVVKDQAVDDATPIVTIGDTVYKKADVKQMVNGYLSDMQNYYAQQYGYQIDTSDASFVASAQEAVINDLIKQTMIEKKAAELGASPLTDEEKAEVEAQYQSYVEMLEGMLGEHEHAEGDEAQHAAEIDYYMAYVFGVTREGLEYSKIESKLEEIVTKDAVPTEEEIVASYEARVASAKTTYETTPTAYGIAVNNGTTVFYRPAGYRMVKNLLIQYSDEYQADIAALNEKAAAQNAIADSLLEQINANEGVDLDAMLAKVNVTVDEATVVTATDLAAETAVADTFEATEDETQKAIQNMVKDYAAAKELAAAYTAKAAALTEEAYASIDAEADEALAKLAAGEDWDAVMAAYTDDPGMQGDRATAKTGYAVCEGFTSFDTAFVTTAMSLEKVGDYSDKTRGASNGYYIIKYVSDVEEGPVDLETVRTSVTTTATTNKKTEVYDAAVAEWVAGANAVIDRNALNN